MGASNFSSKPSWATNTSLIPNFSKGSDWANMRFSGGISSSSNTTGLLHPNYFMRTRLRDLRDSLLFDIEPQSGVKIYFSDLGLEIFRTLSVLLLRADFENDVESRLNYKLEHVMVESIYPLKLSLLEDKWTLTSGQSIYLDYDDQVVGCLTEIVSELLIANNITIYREIEHLKKLAKDSRWWETINELFFRHPFFMNVERRLSFLSIASALYNYSHLFNSGTRRQSLGASCLALQQTDAAKRKLQESFLDVKTFFRKHCYESMRKSKLHLVADPDFAHLVRLERNVVFHIMEKRNDSVAEECKDDFPYLVYKLEQEYEMLCIIFEDFEQAGIRDYLHPEERSQSVVKKTTHSTHLKFDYRK